jgi:hypothetical protein
MVEMMLLAHLLGDYVFQTDALVRWKLRSLWGVVAHGAVVTLCLWLCSLPFSLTWWPYALGVDRHRAGPARFRQTDDRPDPVFD